MQMVLSSNLSQHTKYCDCGFCGFPLSVQTCWRNAMTASFQILSSSSFISHLSYDTVYSWYWQCCKIRWFNITASGSSGPAIVPQRLDTFEMEVEESGWKTVDSCFMFQLFQATHKVSLHLSSVKENSFYIHIGLSLDRINTGKQ
jgi:hypothetical protein